MGTVFEAFEEKMGRRVALKLLSRHLSASQKAASRFVREAWIAGKLNHPNLVRVFDRGELDEISYISMELVDGGSLHEVIRNLKLWGKDERWNLEFGSREYVNWAINQIVAAARGLDYAHRHKVFHLDVKPANLLLNRDPLIVKVADFGLAVDAEGTRITTVGTVMGTVAYMAPEQIRGRRDQVGPWTDAYSLGVSLFELLTLDLPFAGATQQLYMNAVLTAEAKRPRKLNERVSRDLEVVLHKSLEKDPKDRYLSAAALADDLENVLHFRPILAKPPGPLARTLKWARRKPMHASLAAALVLGTPALAILSYRTIQRQRLVQALDVQHWTEEARRLNHDERFQQALPLLDKILAKRPDDAETLRTRSLVFYRLADQEKQADRRQRWRAKALEDATRLIRSQPQAGWPYRLRAFFLRRFGRVAEAERDESSAEARRAPGSELRNLDIEGMLAMEAGRFEEAVRIFSQIIEQRRDASEARFFRASAYRRLGQTGKAMTDFEVAIALAPSDSVARIDLGQLLSDSDELERADKELRKAITIDPRSAPAFESLSNNLIRQGKKEAASGNKDAARGYFKQAEEAARQALRVDDQRAWAHSNVGVALMEQNRLAQESNPASMAEATREYEKAIALAGTGVKWGSDAILRIALANQCDALIQLRDLQEALRSCERIAQLEPTNPVNHYNVAAVYALLHRTDDALRALEKDFNLGDRDYQTLVDDPCFESLRSNPRFISLLKRMKTAEKASSPK